MTEKQAIHANGPAYLYREGPLASVPPEKPSATPPAFDRPFVRHLKRNLPALDIDTHIALLSEMQPSNVPGVTMARALGAGLNDLSDAARDLETEAGKLLAALAFEKHGLDLRPFTAALQRMQRQLGVG